MDTHEIRFGVDFGSSDKTVYSVFLGEKLLGTFDTNEEAWRFIDKQNNENLNPQEKKSEWIAKQILGGTGR